MVNETWLPDLNRWKMCNKGSRNSCFNTDQQQLKSKIWTTLLYLWACKLNSSYYPFVWCVDLNCRRRSSINASFGRLWRRRVGCCLTVCSSSANISSPPSLLSEEATFRNIDTTSMTSPARRWKIWAPSLGGPRCEKRFFHFHLRHVESFHITPLGNKDNLQLLKLLVLIGALLFSFSRIDLWWFWGRFFCGEMNSFCRAMQNVSTKILSLFYLYSKLVTRPRPSTMLQSQTEVFWWAL